MGKISELFKDPARVRAMAANACKETTRIDSDAYMRAEQAFKHALEDAFCSLIAEDIYIMVDEAIEKYIPPVDVPDHRQLNGRQQ